MPETTQQAMDQAFLNDAVRQFLWALDAGKDTLPAIEYMRRVIKKLP